MHRREHISVPSREDEGAFVARLLAADKQAFETLVDRHHHELVRLARPFVHDNATAEEVVQDAWVAVLDGLPRFERRSSLKTWIVRILLNIAKTRGVREHRTVASGDAVVERAIDVVGAKASWKRRGDDDGSPERQLLDREAFDVVSRALDSLPANQQAVVMLRDVEGLETRTVCEILGVSEANLRVLHHRARLKLREAMDRYAA